MKAAGMAGARDARMEALVRDIGAAKAEVGATVRKRMADFSANGDWFSELCFCILTANYTAEGGMRIQNAVRDFSGLTLAELEGELRRHGHRFPRARANYIFLARKHKDALTALSGMADSAQRREWLVENVKGLGYKEASHFLRNVGFSDVAIIDRHILAVLGRYGLIEMPKTLTRRRYMEIEGVIAAIARKASMAIGELDLYMWYMKTGKVMK